MEVMKLNIRCIEVQNNLHGWKCSDAAWRCANGMNFMLQYQLKNPDKYLILDSDMFPISVVNIEKYENYECGILLQTRGGNDWTEIKYFWNGIVYFDFTKMKNLHLLNWDPAPDCDVGGMMQNWLNRQTKNLPNHQYDKFQSHVDGIYFIPHLHSFSWSKENAPSTILHNDKLLEFLETDTRNRNQKFFSEVYDDVFFHYRSGGNWQGEGINLHKELTNKLNTILLDH